MRFLGYRYSFLQIWYIDWYIDQILKISFLFLFPRFIYSKIDLCKNLFIVLESQNHRAGWQRVIGSFSDGSLAKWLQRLELGQSAT